MSVGAAVEEIPPPPAGLPRGKLGIAAAFNAAHAEDCECCVPRESALKPGFWKDVGFEEKAQTPEGENLRKILIREVEEEARDMSPIERTGAIFGWKRAGDIAMEEQRWDAAGDAFARGLAFGAVLGELDGFEAFPAWYPRRQVFSLCSEVLARASILEIRLADEGIPEAVGHLQCALRAAKRALELDSQNTEAQDALMQAEGRLNST
mmetsp:Transcript_24545/g.46335  ORF Transcript_24545/g.46335 Transcript_24545/m.46335 type:complete len:208 (-) Transcript_24545:164-787(-)